MTALAIGPTSRSSGLVPKSKLLHSPEAQSGFVPKHSHHGGKNLALQAEKPKIATKTITNTFGDSMVPELFFSEAVFLLLDVCNNDSYVLSGMAWRKSSLLKTRHGTQHRSSEGATNIKKSF